MTSNRRIRLKFNKIIRKLTCKKALIKLTINKKKLKKPKLKKSNEYFYVIILQLRKNGYQNWYS